MGKWGVNKTRQIGGHIFYTIADGGMRVADAYDKASADAICLMHNEGVELLKDAEWLLIGLNARDESSLIKKKLLIAGVQDLLKRMGVDCGN